MKLAACVVRFAVSRCMVCLLLTALVAAELDVAIAQKVSSQSNPAGVNVVVAPPSIVKSFSAATAPLNTSVTLTFTITNPNGATDLTGVSVNDTLPSGLIIANPDSLTGTCDPGVITPAVTSINLVGGTILAGSSCVFSVDVLAIAGGTQVNTTDPVTSNEGGTGNTATATVDVPLPDLAITKTHTGNFTRGQTGATYTITVTNVGGATTTSDVTVTDTLPAGLNATAISGPGWICTTLTSCFRGDGLDAGLSFPDITLTVSVNFNAAASVTNTATVSGGGEANTGNDTATDPTTTVAGVSGGPLQLAAEILNLQVTAGGTTSTVLDVNSSVGVGTITFACSGLPVGATCSFNPPSVTTLTAQVTMSISTAGRASIVPPPGGVEMPPVYAMLVLLGLTAMCIGLVTQRRTRLAVCLGSIALLCALAGCGSEKVKGTPEGTSTITVTASSASGTSSTVAVTLTVLRPGPVP